MIQNVLCDFSWTEFFCFGCCDTVLSCKNLICCPTSRCIFCSCAVFSSSLLFMSIKEYILTLPVLILSPELPIFLKPTALLKDSPGPWQSHILMLLCWDSVFISLRSPDLPEPSLDILGGKKPPQTICIDLAHLAHVLLLYASWISSVPLAEGHGKAVLWAFCGRLV